MKLKTANIRLYIVIKVLPILSAILSLHSCLAEKEAGNEVLLFFCTGGYFSKSVAPDETKITDANVFIFNRDGLLEQKAYLSGAQLQSFSGGFSLRTSLLKNGVYSIYACTNLGFELPYTSLDALLRHRFYMAYPDEYRIGVTMCGILSDFSPGDLGAVTVPLERTMAKISVSIDRSELDSDVEFIVTGIKICNCPKSTVLFQGNSVDSENSCHAAGFSRSGADIYALNRNVAGQKSGEVSLYMFENLQGSPLGKITDYADKVFDSGDPHEWKCSYIELTADYVSDSYYSAPGRGLIYRFYLGESPESFDVRRNCHYHVTVVPAGDGLPDCRWRVDKTNIEPSGNVYLRASPTGEIKVRVGDSLHVSWDYSPASTEVEFDMSFWEFDDPEAGLFEYTVDDNGRGAMLNFTGSGFCILTIEAGEPIDDIEMLAITVVGTSP